MKKQYLKCNLCESLRSKYLFSGKDWILGGNENFNLTKCLDCGLVFLNPRPTNFDEIYPCYYYKNYGEQKAGIRILESKKERKILKFKKEGRLLDVGCNKGFFLADMKKYNWDVWGVDISSFSCEYAKKTFKLENIFCANILDIEFEDNFFDVITLWQVIEHLEEPLEVLKKLNRFLKKEGFLLIECPNFSSFSAKIFKDKWQGLDLPRHFFQFNPKTLKKLLNKAGFEVKKIDYFGNLIFNLVILRTSILRALKIEKRPENINKNSLTVTKKRNFSWIILRTIFTFFCFFASCIFSFLRISEVICVYATKNETN
ncbi:MAG: class I SAM-dependent methyltransferase [Candidatus Omnitrophica bacterium]|nr:class I SAM-dependent methyltransferase [Candidatus Omnitrophota bacterium]